MGCKTPDRDCPVCPRLAAFRNDNRARHPGKFNAPVPSFGGNNPELLVVGLAPGLKGANFSGRPFTGDYAGDLLYPTLLKFGFARGTYGRSPDDGFTLVNARVTNAVRCVPPENKPTGDEIDGCRSFLVSELASLTKLKVVLALGSIAHNSFLRALGLSPSAYKFGHAKLHRLAPLKGLKQPILLVDSYHCSRYNVNTGRLTTEMFEDAMALAAKEINKKA